MSDLSLHDASCIFRMKKEPFLALGQLYRGDNEMGATPAGSDARMETRAAAAVDH